MELEPIRRRPRIALPLLGPLLLAAGCVDGGPHAPQAERSARLALAPRFAAAPAGSDAASAETGLQAAYDRVNRFRVVARRPASEEPVRDTVYAVTPGAESHRLRLELPLRNGDEEFAIGLTGLEDETPFFDADPVRVELPVSGDPFGIVSVEPLLSYAGPGVDAAGLLLRPGVVATRPGVTAGPVEAVAIDELEEPIPDVPVGWRIDDEEVGILVGAGRVEGVAAGRALARASTPTGIVADAPVYVVDEHLLDFDTDAAGAALSSGDALDLAYASPDDELPDVELRPGGVFGCGDETTVFANDFVASTGLTANAVSLCNPLLEETAEFSEDLEGWVEAMLVEAPAATVCLRVWGGAQGGQGVVRAYDDLFSEQVLEEVFSSRLAAGESERVCVQAGEPGTGSIRRVRFAGAGATAMEFDDLEILY